MKDTVTVNGRQIGQSSDIVDLVRRQLKSGTALGQLPDEGREIAVFALVKACVGTSIENRVVQAIFDLLTDPDVEVRSGAVDVIQQFPALFDPTRLLEVLEAHPSMYQGSSSGSNKPDLASGLLRAVAARPTSDQRVVERLRKAATDPLIGPWILAGITTNDTDWVLDHVPELIDNDPSRARILLFRLTKPGQRERLIRGIPRESPSLRSVLASAVSEEIKDPVEREHLLNLLK